MYCIPSKISDGSTIFPEKILSFLDRQRAQSTACQTNKIPFAPFFLTRKQIKKLSRRKEVNSGNMDVKPTVNFRPNQPSRGTRGKKVIFRFFASNTQDAACPLPTNQNPSSNQVFSSR
jgi:hypothetical protein